MSDLARVRAEIKTWERDFAAKHGRDPSVKDIRDQPFIAEKYKRYKKLSKHASSSPVSRARKRLRGDPVSPSPTKPKRQRCIRSPAPASEHRSSNSDHESDALPRCDFTSSFVADSPVKPPAGGKSFKLLFDDALPALSIPKKPLGHPGEPRSSQSCPLDTPIPSFLKPRRDRKSVAINPVQPKPSHIFPAKDYLPHEPSFNQPRTSTKHALDSSDPVSLYPLIPPSPPPQDPVSRDPSKAKAKVTAGRKKLRVEDQESDQDVDSSDGITLKVATVSFGREMHCHTDDFDWDPLLHLGTPNHEPSAMHHIDHASGTFSIDLPDEFRRVLAISPSRSQDSKEERVVRGLLYGDRIGHYDPSRGGDIWDAGETDEGALGDAEIEDDWEGEPVPWDLGEL